MGDTEDTNDEKYTNQARVEAPSHVPSSRSANVFDSASPVSLTRALLLVTALPMRAGTGVPPPSAPELVLESLLQSFYEATGGPSWGPATCHCKSLPYFLSAWTPDS